MTPRIVLTCGGRRFADQAFVNSVFHKLHIEATIGLLVHGGCGVWDAVRRAHIGWDHLAHCWAVCSGVQTAAYAANWELGRKAGPLRNEAMLVHSRPSLVIAGPGGVGTADMVRRARKAGVEVVEVRQ